MSRAEQLYGRTSDREVRAVVVRDGAADAEAPAAAVAVAPPERLQLHSVALVGLFTLAVLYTLFVARVLILPVVLAIITSFILSPVVRVLKHFHIPEAIGALVVLFGLTASVGSAAYTLAGPATTWFQAAPQAFHRIEVKLRVLKDKVQDFGHATSQVEKLTSMTDPAPVVAVQGSGLGESLLFGTWNLFAATGMVLILAYFLLASGNLFLRKMVGAMHSLHDRKLVVSIAHELQDSISAYLFTVSVINAAFGAAVALIMWALAMPNPLLWGALAATLNFVPFIGPLVGIGVVFGAATLTYDSLPHALIPPLAYLGLHITEGSFLTPMILSRRFTLNPVVVLLGLLFWGWIWGIPGALLAMPLLVTLKILCDYIPSLAVLGEFLGK
ncbi:MAG: AI-2E family transporter [bacterium]